MSCWAVRNPPYGVSASPDGIHIFPERRRAGGGIFSGITFHLLSFLRRILAAGFFCARLRFLTAAFRGGVSFIGSFISFRAPGFYLRAVRRDFSFSGSLCRRPSAFRSISAFRPATAFLSASFFSCVTAGNRCFASGSCLAAGFRLTMGSCLAAGAPTDREALSDCGTPSDCRALPDCGTPSDCGGVA